VNVVVAAGATRTMLGIEVCTINVAVIVPCVFGSAFACPLHILNAATATFSVNEISISLRFLDEQYTFCIISLAKSNIIF